MTTIQIIGIIIFALNIVLCVIGMIVYKPINGYLAGFLGWVSVLILHLKLSIADKPHSTIQELDKQCTEVAMHTFKTGYLMGIDHLREERTWNEYRWLHDSTVISNVINNGQNIR
jgi:peptidoglycan biosynthesis protein MviN/MurJ (putative lipid II flippase)